MTAKKKKRAKRISDPAAIRAAGKEAAATVGHLAEFALVKGLARLQVAVLILDVRFAWGRWDLLIVPVLGGGSMWTHRHTLTLTDIYDKCLSPAAAEQLELRANAVCGSEPAESSATGD